MPMTRKVPDTAATDAKDDEDARPATNRKPGTATTDANDEEDARHSRH